MSFGDIPTTTATSGMVPSQIWFDGLQPLALTDRGVAGRFFLSVAGVLDRHSNSIIYQIVWLLYYIIFWLYLRSVDDTRVYIFIYKCVQTGVICWAEEGPECNVMPPIIFFLLFSRLNGSAKVLNLEYITTTTNKKIKAKKKESMGKEHLQESRNLRYWSPCQQNAANK